MPARENKTETATAAELQKPVDLGLLPDLIGYQLRRAQLAVFQDYVRSVGELTPAQFAALVVIERNLGLSQTELGQSLGIDRSTLVAVIDRLENRGLVERADAPRDRRSYALHISNSGRALLADLTERVRAHEAYIAGDLSAADRVALIGLLRRVRRSEA